MSKQTREPSSLRRVVRIARVLALLVLTAGFAIGCAANDGSPDSDSSETGSSETGSSEKSVRSPEMRELDVQRISSGDQGLEQRRIVVASSAAALSKETGMRISGSGEGVYVAAFWGRKKTGGYSVAVESAKVEGDEVEIRLALREPPPDAFVAQAITYPYAVAVLRGADLGGKRIVVKSEGGRELDWPVARAGG